MVMAAEERGVASEHVGAGLRLERDPQRVAMARVVTDPKSAGQRQLSVFRSWDFDAAVVVRFDDEFRVWRAARLPRDIVKDAGYWSEHVRGWRVMATDGRRW